MAEYLKEVLQDKLDLSGVNVQESKKLPSPEILKGKVLVKVNIFFSKYNTITYNIQHTTHNIPSSTHVFQGKKLPANIDPDAEEGDVSDEDTGDEEDDDDDDDDNTQATETLGLVHG